jgi:hypothetical protein
LAATALFESVVADTRRVFGDNHPLTKAFQDNLDAVRRYRRC